MIPFPSLPRFAAALFLTCVLLGNQIMTPSAAFAQSDIMERIKARAKERRDVIDLIEKSPDKGLRIVAFEEAMKSSDMELKQSAMTAAFGSNDNRLRKLALRTFLDGRSELSFNFILPDRASEGQRLLYDRYFGMRFSQVTVDPNSGLISFNQRANQYWSGQLADDGFTLIYQRPPVYSKSITCKMTMRVKTATLMAGKLDCVFVMREWLKKTRGNNRAVIPVTLSLN